MPATRQAITAFFGRLRQTMDEGDAARRFAVKGDEPPGERIRASRLPTTASLASVWRTLARAGAGDADRVELADEGTISRLSAYASNIENMIGTVKVPVGIAGPLRINGLHAAGDYYVPLATTEGALVASYTRGSYVIGMAGGCTAAMLSESLTRSPGFAFASMLEAGLFSEWCLGNFAVLKEVAETTTRHGKLIDITAHLEADHVYLVCRYTTGDAAGQNMTTIATEAVCRHIVAEAPVKPRFWFVEANFSGDKKASAFAFIAGRGRKATAMVELPRALVETQLHTTIERMHDYWLMSALGGVMSGTMGVQGHYANGLAALYLATGQDIACVSESSVGVTRMEVRGDNLFVSVTLPNIMVGTVGGGTGLPSQSAGLRILGLAGNGHAPALAEVAAALCLAGEISIIGALCAGDFVRAHRTLARDRR